MDTNGETCVAKIERTSTSDIRVRLNRHVPQPTEPEDGCVHCREPMPESDTLPFLTRGGHVWLHSRCHAPWIARLRAEAVTALAG